MVLDLANAFERVSLPWAEALKRVSVPVGLGRRISIFSMKILLVLCGYFEHQRRVHFEGSVAEAAPGHHGHLLWVKVELHAPAHRVTE